jgi:hypothetical protein
MLPTDLSPKAQQIIDRLSAIDYENPKICEQRIREAFSRHLIALNQRDRPVEVYHSLFDALDAATRESTFDAEWDAAFEAAEKAVSDAVFEAASAATSDATNHLMSDAAFEAARKAAFDVASAAASRVPRSGAVKVAWDDVREAARKAAFDAAFRAVNKTASDPLWNTAWNTAFDIVFPWAWGDARDAAKKALNVAALRTGWNDEWNAGFKAGWKAWSDYASDQAFRYALEAVTHTSLSAYGAARDRARNAAMEGVYGDWGFVGDTTETVVEKAVEIVNHTTSSPEHEQFCAVWMPFVDAVEAGLFCFWVTTTKVIALTLPVMRIEDDWLHQLHADGQPAVQWSDWECYYFWRGLQIPQKYGAVLSENWRSQWLLEESNAELRRVLIQGIGYDRIVQDLEAVELDAWREYSLLKIQADIDVEPIHLLKMTCPSTNHIHVLRVPPDLTSARAAIRWANWDIDPEAFAAET